MSVISWDYGVNTNTSLTEKQMESIFVLSSMDSALNEQDSIDSHDMTKESQSLENCVALQIASHFYTKLWSLEQEIETGTSQFQMEFLEFVTSVKSECLTISKSVDDILLKLKILEDNYLSISQRTNELHELCEHLLRQQNELSESASFIEHNLVYFTQVDSIHAELGVRNCIVSRERFQPLLDKLNSSIVYFRDHPHFKEASSYSIKAKQVLLKALNLIKFNVTRIIQRTINELLELHDVITPENSFILLYGRFRSQGPKIRLLVTLLEERFHITDEYAQILYECHKFYLQHREEILIPVAVNGVNDLVQKYSGDHCALLRTAGTFMAHMCEDEIKLFNQFFAPQFSNSINQMLSKLCQCLYDAIRPLIIHINHMEILSEMCDILQHELSETNEIASNTTDVTAFNNLCAMLLADIQERLIFRSHIYIKSEILGYSPSAGDLSYPEKLEMMIDIAKNTSENQNENPVQKENVTSSMENIDKNENPNDSHKEYSNKIVNSCDLIFQPGPNMSLTPADLHGMWYPVVRRTLVCLSKLSRCLNADSFRGLAQECVSMCVQSLVKASELIESRRTALDGQLFLIKHLLILREQIAPFNVEFLVQETSLDFSTYKNLVRKMWEEKGSGLFTLNRTNTLLRFLLETPNAIDVEIDSRRQLDGQLKYVCELLIEQQILNIIGELVNFLKRAHAVLSAPGARLSDQPFANVSAVKDMISTTYRSICHSLGREVNSNNTNNAYANNKNPNLRKHLHIYLANPDTEQIILRRIQMGIINYWHDIYHLLIDQYTDEDRMIIACPTESQIRLLFQDVWSVGALRS